MAEQLKKFKGNKATVNQTGRTKIMTKDYDMEIDYESRIPKITVSRLEVPDNCADDAKVVIDVYNRTIGASQRIDCGTKANLKLPQNLPLSIGYIDVKATILVISEHGDVGLIGAKTAVQRAGPQKGETTVVVEDEDEGGYIKFNPIVITQGALPHAPSRVVFPSEDQGQVEIQINTSCALYYEEMNHPTARTGIWILTVLPHLRSILMRIVSDCVADEFDPTERLHADSKWQCMWNHWVKEKTGQGLQDIDSGDNEQVDEWIEDAVNALCGLLGNPVRQVNRLMSGGGVA